MRMGKKYVTVQLSNFVQSEAENRKQGSITQYDNKYHYTAINVETQDPIRKLARHMKKVPSPL